MFLSDLSVRRPVLSTVFGLLLVVFGVVSFVRLPVREYTDIDPPIVSVESRYPGAAAAVVETRLTPIVEDAISGIEGIRSIDSVSRDGVSEVIVEFYLDRDLEAAVNDIRDRVSRILGSLPEEADPPEIFKVDANSSVIMWLNLVSDRMDGLALTDYAERYLVVRQGRDGHLIRIGAVARVERDAEDDRSVLRGNRIPMVGLGIVRQSKANTLDVARAVKQAAAEVNKTLPEGMELIQSYDTSVFIEASIAEVYKTLAITALLVIAVLFVFLGSLRATLVPAVTVPVSLTVAGAVPLILASGAGAESRFAIGVVIFSGVALSTLLTLFLIPMAIRCWPGSQSPPTGSRAKSKRSNRNDRAWRIKSMHAIVRLWRQPIGTENG